MYFLYNLFFLRKTFLISLVSHGGSLELQVICSCGIKILKIFVKVSLKTPTCWSTSRSMKVSFQLNFLTLLSIRSLLALLSSIKLISSISSTELPEYISGKRVGPGVLNNLGDGLADRYKISRRGHFKEYLVWLEIRKLKTYPLLLVPGWTGFNIAVRKTKVVIESAISYLDTIDSPATDLRTANQVLCRGERLSLEAVVCVFDQAFYAKAMEVYWKNKEMFKHLIIMLGGFHLLMMLLGVIGLRFGDAGLREIAIQGDVISEG